MNLFEKFKEDISLAETYPRFLPNKYIDLIKQSYLNAIDCMIEMSKPWDRNLARVLKEQRNLIENYGTR